MARLQLRVTLAVTDGSHPTVYLRPEGEFESVQTDPKVLRGVMLERLGRVIKSDGLLAVSPTNLINTAHIVRVQPDKELEGY